MQKVIFCFTMYQADTREGKLKQQIIWGDSEEKLFCYNYLILVEAGRKFHEKVIFNFDSSNSSSRLKQEEFLAIKNHLPLYSNEYIWNLEKWY